VNLLKKSIALLAAAVMLTPGFAEASENDVALRVYVSKSGDDTNNGSEVEPFATLEGARNYLRSFNKNNLPKGRIEVVLKEGEYIFEETFNLEKEDSGSENNPVIFMGEKGKKVKITNSRSIANKGFKLVEDEETLKRLPEEARGKVYKIDLKSFGITDYGQVERKEYGKGVKKYFEIYFNGNTLTLSRYPNDKYMLTGQVQQIGGEGVCFKYEGDRYMNWALADQALVYGFWNNDTCKWIGIGV